MTWKIRLFLSLITVLLAVLLGGVGGFLGPKLSLWTWLLVLFVAAVLVLPWGSVTFSQEDVLTEIRAFDQAIEELSQRRPQLQELAQELDAERGLNQQQFKELLDRYLEVQRLSEPSQQAMREALFGLYRRTLAVQIVMILMAGIGGALLAFSFTRWLG